MRLTAATRSSSVTSGPAVTWAVSNAKFTSAVTPGSLLRDRSMRLAHDEHVIPVISRSTL